MFPWAFVLVLAGLLAFAMLGWWWERGRTSRANRARQVVALRGESDAEALLSAAGFEIIDRQLTTTWSLWVDGSPHPVRSRVDLLVVRHGKRFAVDVKTGDIAPDPRHPATRRQLLEYLLAFEVDGVLLVDMRARRIHEIAFFDGSELQRVRPG